MMMHRWTVGILIVANFIAALFEGGTLGLLGLAIAALIGEAAGELPKFMGELGVQLTQYIQSMSRGTFLLTLVVFAIVAQIIKAISLYIGQGAQIVLSYSLRRDLQGRLTHKIIAMSYSHVSKYPTGTLANIIDQSSLVTDVSVQQCLARQPYGFSLCWHDVHDIVEDGDGVWFGDNYPLAIIEHNK